MKNIKKIIGSLLLATAFAATSVGTTFALFTDEAKTTINVQSGKIELKSALTIAEVKSLNDSTIDTHTMITDEAHKNASYENGGAVAISTDSVTNVESVSITKWTPGDSVKLLATPNNSGTNINTLIRLQVTMTGELAPALVVKGYAGDATDPSFMMTGERTNVTPWTPVNAGENPSSYYLEVSFPNHGSEITSNLEGTDNHYQNKEASIIVSYQAVQGNASTNDVLERANSLLATHEVEASKRYETMNAALKGIESHFTDAELVTLSQYVWGSQEDQFFVDEASIRNHNYFKQVTSASEGNGYSLYAKAGWTAASVPLTGIGFDAGDVSGITSVTYGNATDNRTVIIRTNSAGTSLTINDGSEGKIYHYGPVGDLNIIECHTNSYHEFGKVAYAQISTGRIVLEPTSNVEKIHINANEDKDGFKEIIIADNGVESENLPTSITRDKVDVDEQKIVVTVQNLVEESAEPVYVYPHTDATETATGTTEKITEGENKQNENVESVLGQLVLDSSLDAGEKAMSENDKETAKEKAVEEAIVEEVQEEIDQGANYVCRIGAVGYETLAAAVADVKADNSVYTIVVLKNIENQGSRVNGGKKIELDLNGFKLSYTSSFTPDNAAFYIQSGNSLTIKNGSISNAKSMVVMRSDSGTLSLDHLSYDSNNGAALYNFGTGTIKDCTFSCTKTGTQIMNGNNQVAEGNLTIDRTTVSIHIPIASGTAVIVANNRGSMNLKNSTITVEHDAVTQGYSGYNANTVENRGTTVIDNCTITSDANHTVANASGSTLMTIKGEDTYISNTSDIKNAIDNFSTLVVNDGTFVSGPNTSTGTGNAAISHHTNSVSTINGGTFIATQSTHDQSDCLTLNTGLWVINGGTYNKKIDAEGTYDPNKVTWNGYVIDNGDNTWSVISPTYVIHDDGKVYKNNFLQEYTYSALFGLVENDPLSGLAQEGEVIYFSNGHYVFGGHFFTQPGVILIGESREGVVVSGHSGDNVFTAEGDLTVMNMTLESAQGWNYSITPDIKGTSYSKAIGEWDCDFVIKNVTFSNTSGAKYTGYDEYTSAVNVPGLGNTLIENCKFEYQGSAICNVRDLNGSKTTIKGCTFVDTKEAIGYVASDVLAATVSEWMTLNTGLVTYDNVFGAADSNDYTKGYIRNRTEACYGVCYNYVTGY